jgi:hypothetical protein
MQLPKAIQNMIFHYTNFEFINFKKFSPMFMIFLRLSRVTKLESLFKISLNTVTK